MSTDPHVSAETGAVPTLAVDDFTAELRALINRHSFENRSNTPDFILARYLMECLRAWEVTCQLREEWYGEKMRPGMGELPIQFDGDDDAR